MAKVKEGSRVRINFTGTLEDGTVFDTTYDLGQNDCSDDACGDDACSDDSCGDAGCGCNPEPGPMALTIGSEEFFPAIEEALIGMAPGDKKTLTLTAEEGCGEYDEELVFTIPRDQFPADVEPAEGDDLELAGDDDEGMVVTVVDVTDTDVTVDANHPLAGEELTFELELVSIG